MIESERSTATSVLLVDDEELLAATLARGLEMRGFEAAYTTSPEKALRLTAQRDFDVAVVDLVMPTMEGIDLVGALRRIDPRLRCIILTGHASLDSCRKAFLDGVADFVTKPISYARLADTIDATLACGVPSMPLSAILRSVERFPEGEGEIPSLANLVLNPLSLPLDEFRRQTERLYLWHASMASNGVVKKIASLAGCSLANAYRLLKVHGVAFDRHPTGRRTRSN